MSRVKMFEKIHREHRDGVPILGLADTYSAYRRTVRQAITDAVPPPRKTPRRDTPVLGPWKGTVRGCLEDDLAVPRKQRHTVRRVWERLIVEHCAQVGESTVRRFVVHVKADLAKTPLAAVPQTHGHGVEAEVDFAEFSARLDGNGPACGGL